MPRPESWRSSFSTWQKIPRTSSTELQVRAQGIEVLIFMILNAVTLEYEISCRFGRFRALLRVPVQIEWEETRCDFGLHCV
jgi:hypothetical protein